MSVGSDVYWYYTKSDSKDSKPQSDDKELQTLIAFKLVGCDSSLAFKILLTMSAGIEPNGTPLTGADMRVYKKQLTTSCVKKSMSWEVTETS